MDLVRAGRLRVILAAVVGLCAAATEARMQTDHWIHGSLSDMHGQPIVQPNVAVITRGPAGPPQIAQSKNGEFHVRCPPGLLLVRVLFQGTTKQVFDRYASGTSLASTVNGQRLYLPEILATLRADRDHEIHKVLWAVGDDIPASAQANIAEAHRLMMETDRQRDRDEESNQRREHWLNYVDWLRNVSADSPNLGRLCDGLSALIDEVWSG